MATTTINSMSVKARSLRMPQANFLLSRCMKNYECDLMAGKRKNRVCIWGAARFPLDSRPCHRLKFPTHPKLLFAHAKTGVALGTSCEVAHRYFLSPCRGILPAAWAKHRHGAVELPQSKLMPAKKRPRGRFLRTFRLVTETAPQNRK